MGAGGHLSHPQNDEIWNYQFEIVPPMPDGTKYGGIAVISAADASPTQSVDRLIRGMLSSMARTHRRVADEAAQVGEIIDVAGRIAYLEARAAQPPTSPPYVVTQIVATPPVALEEDQGSDPAPQAMPANGTGWAPEFGMWLVYADGKVVPSGSNVEYRKYMFSGYSSWHTSAQLARYAGNANSGYELGFSYKQYSDARQSGVTSQTTGYITDFPGHYSEFLTIDDNVKTYGVGTHEGRSDSTYARPRQ